jgi:hypothetical protein
MDYNIPHIAAIEEHAKAIGYVCIYWAALEHGVDSMLQTLTPLEPGKVSNSITANADIREKLRMLMAIGLVRKPSEGWFGKLRSIINEIDDELRPERNRHIHDLWMGFSPVIRRTRKTSIKRPQSRQPFELTTYEEIPIEPAKIWALVNAISNAQVTLKLLESKFREQAALPSIPPQQPKPDRSF